jgi:hypothetical protein
MNTRLSKSLAILFASVAMGVEGAPPATIIPPVGGTMSSAPLGGTMSPGSVGGHLGSNAVGGQMGPGALGGTMSPGPVGGQMGSNALGGTLSPYGFIGPTLVTGSAFSNGPSGGTFFNAVTPANPGATVNGGTFNAAGVGAVNRNVVIAGGSSSTPSGARGVYHPVIVAGGTPNTGGTFTNGTSTPTPHSVIVAGGSTN